MRAVARRTDPLTSHEAAWSLRDLNELQQKVLGVLADLGRAATSDEVIAAYEEAIGPVAESTVRTRLRELERFGAVERAGYGQSERGNRCVRYRPALVTR